MKIYAQTQGVEIVFEFDTNWPKLGLFKYYYKLMKFSYQSLDL